ncbi:MAG: S-layer homology domain-containing protein [Gudongella sp.]|jgi:hypothetical protein|nr:S-layer homology domain-containing protein [Gudongella sp.]
MLKRIAIFAITLIMILSITTTFAIVPDNMGVVSSNIVTQGINNMAEDQANMLKGLGLFLGTDKGFELDRHLNRAEAAALIVRFMGEEKNAMAQSNKHPFVDVPIWADPYVGWLYKNKITNGIDATHYGSLNNVTYWQFATLLSRVSAGFDDFISTGVGKEDELDSIDQTGQESLATNFSRADAVSILTRFMRLPYFKDQSRSITIAQYLLEKEVFTTEQFVDFGTKIYPVYYSGTENGEITAQMESVVFSTSDLSGISGNTTYPTVETEYFYAWVNKDDSSILYKLDALSLEETIITEWNYEALAQPKRIYYFTTLSGSDFLGVWHEDGVSLIATDGVNTDIIASGKDFKIDNLQEWESYLWDNGKLLIVIDNTVYLFTEQDMITHQLPENTTFIGFENGLAILYSKDNENGIIQGVQVSDWTTTDTYNIPLENAPYEGYPMVRQHHGGIYDSRGSGIYGEGGLYVVEEGRLVQITSRPVLDLSFVRIGASGAYVILSHEPGTAPFGSSIYQYNPPYMTGEDNYVEVERLGNDPEHGIMISGISGRDSMVFFYSSIGVGMDNYDEFTYYPVFNAEEDHIGIVVMNFTAGRPEISFYEHDAQWYVQEEQKRLNELGYRP